MNVNGKRILVLGLGLSGVSMIRWLAPRGALVRAADSRADPPGIDAVRAEFPDLAIDTGPFRPASFANVDLIAISPGVALATAEVQAMLARGVEVVGDVELFARALDAICRSRALIRPAVLAITGSNGKSTVTEMTGALCRGAGLETLVAGNIGLPVLDALGEIEAGTRPWPRCIVLELSSFQLETTAGLRPDAAVVLNLSEDHLDRYRGMSDYAAAKARIFDGASVQIVNRDDPWSRSMARSDGSAWTFGLGPPAARGNWGLVGNGDDHLAEGELRILSVAKLRVPGMHNAANALAALALGRAIGLDYQPLARALEKFEGLPHRVQLVTEIDGRRFYDDSKGTNVGATVAALNGMAAKVVLIAGGDGKGQDFAPLAPVVAGRARAVVLIGRDREAIADAIAGAGVPLRRAAGLDEAVRTAFAISEPGDAVMLSPACASFDMFRNYEHRAEVFRAAVQKLQEGEACSTPR
ncbi:MAG: UDP-N-acetylmuramoyl-L-alanine--D-glutamate ligase [Betaproteobacteria bacterium]